MGGEAGRAPSGGLISCACSRTGWGRHHHHQRECGDWQEERECGDWQDDGDGRQEERECGDRQE